MHRDVAIIGAGYVGVPLAQVFADAGRSVLLVDVSPERVAQLNRGESYIEDVPSEKLKQLVGQVRFVSSDDTSLAQGLASGELVAAMSWRV